MNSHNELIAEYHATVFNSNKLNIAAIPFPTSISILCVLKSGFKIIYPCTADIIESNVSTNSILIISN